METPQGFFEKIKMLPKLAGSGRFPKSVSPALAGSPSKGTDVNYSTFPF